MWHPRAVISNLSQDSVVEEFSINTLNSNCYILFLCLLQLQLHGGNSYTKGINSITFTIPSFPCNSFHFVEFSICLYLFVHGWLHENCIGDLKLHTSPTTRYTQTSVTVLTASLLNTSTVNTGCLTYISTWSIKCTVLFGSVSVELIEEILCYIKCDDQQITLTMWLLDLDFLVF